MGGLAVYARLTRTDPVFLWQPHTRLAILLLSNNHALRPVKQITYSKESNMKTSNKNLAVTSQNSDITTINNTTTSSKDSTMTTAKTTPATSTTKAPEVKTAKPVVTIKDIKVANITITEKSSCIIFENANKVRWYLKGSTLEITTVLAAIKDRVENFTKEKIESGRYGKIVGVIRKVNTNQDLTTLLNLLVAIPAHAKTTKAAKVEIPTPAAKDSKKPAAKKPAAKKTTAKIITPAVEDKAPVAQAA